LRHYRDTFDRARYNDAYLLAQPTEDQVQGAALDLLAAMRIPALAVDAGGKRLRGDIGRAMRRGGVTSVGAYLAGRSGAAHAGLSDILGTLPGGRALYIECKQPEWLTRSSKSRRLIQKAAPGKPSDEQLAFLDTMAEAGAVVGIIWSIEDLEQILRGHIYE
jgi:hypothetical protein